MLDRAPVSFSHFNALKQHHIVCLVPVQKFLGLAQSLLKELRLFGQAVRFRLTGCRLLGEGLQLEIALYGIGSLFRLYSCTWLACGLLAVGA